MFPLAVSGPALLPAPADPAPAAAAGPAQTADFAALLALGAGAATVPASLPVAGKILPPGLPDGLPDAESEDLTDPAPHPDEAVAMPAMPIIVPLAIGTATPLAPEPAKPAPASAPARAPTPPTRPEPAALSALAETPAKPQQGVTLAVELAEQPALTLAPVAPTVAPSTEPTTSAPVTAPTPALARPHDFATLVDSLVAAREAAQPQVVGIALAHAEFGPVHLRFRTEDGGLSVNLASADPDFARAATLAVTAPAAPEPAGERRPSGHSASGDSNPRGQDSPPQRRDGQRPRANPAAPRPTAEGAGIFA